MADSTILGTLDVLCQELDEIERRRGRCIDDDTSSPRDDLPTHAERARELDLTALCLSGGGIRSATFCLGVLQALASKHLLRQFDYLSTVSGGGFIGGWLQVLIREAGGVPGAETALSQPRPDALQRLRAYTNYLTPETGPLSSDTWAAIVLYLRNLLINWAVFAPLFLLLTLVPITYRTAIWACSDVQWLNLLWLACAGLMLLYGVVSACSLLPSHRPPGPSGDTGQAYASRGSIRWGVVYPALGWALLIPWPLDFAESRLTADESAAPWLAHHALWIVPVIYFLLMTMGFRLAWWLQSYRNNPGVELFRANFGNWILASIGSSLLTLFLLRIGASILPHLHTHLHIDFATTLTVMAPLALAVVHVLQTSLYVALRRETDFADLDREWLARVNAMILRVVVGWSIFALCCLVLAVRTYSEGGTWSGVKISALGAASVLFGGFSAWLGKIWPSVEALAENPAVMDRVRAHLPVVLGALFAVCLLVVFGGVVNFILAELQEIADAYFAAAQQWLWLPLAMWQVIVAAQHSPWLPLAMQAIVATLLFAGVLMFRHVNVNRFSMHAVYRNRLTRAFLGSARSHRNQDPFTGFDPSDNAPLSTLCAPGNSLFPVINTTLNITTGNNTAWAERQAASFTATPLFCGSAELRHPAQGADASNPRGAFVPTERFAGLETLKDHPMKATESGPGLGNALTVSGAAVSPSWGYHSSRITAFLMTLFNVRLGVWLPNPAKATADELRLARPRNSLMALIDEMLGETTDDSQAIYLSDGGHFENLGLYEMLRRRCGKILVVDAGADEAASLFDLGNAIRKAEIDFGISVTMHDTMAIYPRCKLEGESKLDPLPRGFATGQITYDKEHTGLLLYLKPSFLKQIPADVRSYGLEHQSFPHESTLDQWFTESQFESYRMLGSHQMRELLGDIAPEDLPGLFKRCQVSREKADDSVVIGRITRPDVAAE
jgi:hypothetical protein